jgi:hypothetical protein
VQVHPDHSRSQLGISEELLAAHTDEDSPLAFWQIACPRKLLLRIPALRLLCGKAAALGVERLWSAARLTLTDNRRSMLSARLMQLLQVKLNVHLLNDSALLETLGAHLLQEDQLFDSIFDDLQQFEEAELAEQATKSQLGQPVCELSDEEDSVEDLSVHDDDLDLFTN